MQGSEGGRKILKQEAGTEGGGAIQRQRYTPADDQWITKEEALLQELRKDDEAKRMKLEVELPGSDEILIKVTPLPLCLFMALLAFKLILLARLLQLSSPFTPK